MAECPYRHQRSLGTIPLIMAYKIATGLEAVCDVALIKTYCCSNVASFEMSQTAILLEDTLKMEEKLAVLAEGKP